MCQRMECGFSEAPFSAALHIPIENPHLFERGFISYMEALLFAAIGTGFLFLMTSLGAAAVFFFRREIKPIYEQIFLGFAAGVMMAASVWSLLNPAIAAAEDLGIPGWLPAAGGLIIGVFFLLFSDIAVTRLSASKQTSSGLPDKHTASRHRTFLLQLAMTLHNIPEGMAVGLSFALAAQTVVVSEASALSLLSPETASSLSSAAALALGIGIQNFPEGAAISLPLRQNGMSAPKAFLRGCLSGIVEPIFGILVVLAAGSITPLMPWLLSFAAGAMLYVVAEELIPQANGGSASFAGTLSIMGGFLMMMVLDVALG